MRLTVVVLALVLGVSTASAYPIFQFSSGSNRCSDCHFSPSGGGLLNAFGRSENGDTISWIGNGALLYGAWTPPEALSLGADFRVAGVGIHRDGDEDQLAVFPMQADVSARYEHGPVALGGTVGLNGAMRERTDNARLSSWVVSREHYVMYQEAPGTPYVRAGRFFPSIGIRTADHSALVRRAVDAYTLQEPYALAGGASGDAWELHASLFAPNPFGAGPQPWGATAQYERFVGEGMSLTGQTRVAYTSDDLRVLVGGIAKKWLHPARLLLLGELDVQMQRIGGASVTRTQLLGYAGAHFVVLPGLAVGLVGQRWDPDLLLGNSARTTAEFHLELFPLAHFELYLLGRLGWSGGFADPRDSVGLVQVHYWL